MAYKFVLGKNAAQLRKDRNAKQKAAAVDFMTSEEIQAVTKVTNQISVLHEMGMGYDQIKAMLLNKKLVGNIA